MTAISGFFTNAVLGPLRPPAQIEQWDRDANDPFGFRQWESGNYKPDAKIGLVGGFDAQFESGVVLNFGEIEVVDAGFLTDTVVFTFNFGEINTHTDSFFDQMLAASSVGVNFKAFNMKFWVGNLTAFISVSSPIPQFHFLQSSGWKQGFNVTPGDTDTFVVPTSMPASGNILSNTSSVFISGVYQDVSFSNFVYLRGQFPTGSYPLGTFGGLGERSFTFNFSYDWTDINASVLVSDLLPCLSPVTPVVIPSIPPSGASLPSGMVSFWNLDENSPRIDKFGNTHLQGGLGIGGEPARASGVSINTVFASEFTRTNLEYLTASGISTDLRLDFGDEDFAVAGFVFLNSKPSVEMPILSKWVEPSDKQYMLAYDGPADAFAFSVSSNGTTATKVSGVTFGSPSIGTWYHVYAHHDSVANQLAIAINSGVLDLTSHAGGANQGANNDFELGGTSLSTGRSTFNGRLDAFGVWERTLEVIERVALINEFGSTSGLQFPFNLEGSVSQGINAFWRMNEGSGLSRFDVINGIELQNFNGVKDRVGLIGSGSDFDRDAQTYLEASGFELLAYSDEDFTVGGFFSFNPLAGGQITTPMISKWQAAGDNLEYLLSFDTVANGFTLSVASGGAQGSIVSVTASGVAQSGQWHRVVGWHDSVNDTINIKLDDDVENSATFIGGIHSGIAPFRIGGIPESGIFFDGGVDGVGQWRRLLTAKELGEWFNG